MNVFLSVLFVFGIIVILIVVSLRFGKAFEYIVILVSFKIGIIFFYYIVNKLILRNLFDAVIFKPFLIAR